MLQEFISSWKNIFNFRGRMRRREYWVAYLWNMTITYVIVSLYFLYLSWLTTKIGVENINSFSLLPSIGAIIISMLLIVYSIFITIVQISMCVRRCHDIGYSGWAYLFCVLGSCCCGIGAIVWIVFCCLDSKEDNQWGPNPKKENKYNSAGSIILAIVVFVLSLVVYLVTYIMFLYSLGVKANEYSGAIENTEYNYTIEDDEDDDTSSSEVIPAEFTGKDWQSFQFAIDGKVLTLPCSYEDIQALGFSVEDYMLDETLKNNQYTGIYYVEDNEGRSFYISFLNVSGSDKPIRECDVYRVEFDDFYDLPAVEICGGLTLGMTPDEVKELEGNEPDYEYSSKESDYQSIEYYYNGRSDYGGLDVTITEGKVSVIELENLGYYLRSED